MDQHIYVTDGFEEVVLVIRLLSLAFLAAAEVYNFQI